MERLKELKRNLSFFENQIENAYKQFEQEMFDMFNAVVETTSVFITIIQNEKFVFINSTGIKLLNIKESKDILGKSIYAVLHPDSHQIIKSHIGCLHKKQSDPHIKLKLLKSTGVYLSLEVNSIPIVYKGEQAEILVGRDIAEDIIQEENTEGCLRLDFNTNPIWNWEWDVVNDDVDCSPTYYTILGYNPKEVLSARSIWNDRIHPEDRERVDKIKTDVLRNKIRKYSYEARMLHADGSYRWIYVLGFKVGYNQERKVDRIFGIGMDIHEKKLSELELTKQELQFKTLADNIPDVIVRYDTNFKRTYVNNEYLRITGFTNDQIIGYSPSDFSCLPTDVEQKIENLLNDVAQNMQLKKMDIRLPTDKGYRNISLKAVPEFDMEGNVVSILTIGRDLTEMKENIDEVIKISEELKEKEKTFREIFENSNDNIYLIEVTGDLRFKYFDLNPAFEKATGYKRNELIGKYHEEVLPENIVEARNKQYSYCVKNKVSILNKEVTLELPTGTRTFQSSIIPLFNSAGNVYRIMGIYRDITANKHYEHQLENSLHFIEKIVDSIPTPIYVKDKKHRFILSNKAHNKLRGVPQGKIIGKTDFDLFPEKEARGFWEREENIFATGNEMMTEDIISGNNEDQRDVLLRKAVFTGPDAMLYLTGTVVDITEQKQSVRQIEMFGYALDNASDSIFIAKAGYSGYIYVNNQACSSLEYSRSELLKLSVFDFDMNMTPEILNQIMLTAKPNVSSSFESLHKTKTGKIFPVEISRRMYQYNGESYYFLIAKDITERKQAEIALRESEQRYREMFNNSHDCINLFEVLENGQFRLLDANLQYEKEIDPDCKEHIGNTIEENAAPEVAKIINAKYQHCVDRGTITKETMQLPMPQGERIYDSYLIPIRNDLGKIYRIMGITKDITREIEAKNELDSSRNRLLKAELVASIGHLEYDYSSGIYYWSDGAYEIFKVPSHLRKPGTNDFRELIHPDERETVNNAIKTAVDNLGIFENVYRIIDFQGNEKVIHATGQVQIDSNGKQGNFFGIIQDITLLYNMNTKLYIEEEKYRILAENSPVGIYLSIDGTPNYANDTFLKMIEIDSFDSLLKMDLMELVAQEDKDRINHLIDKIKTGEIKSSHFKFTLHNNQSTSKYFEIFATSFTVNQLKYFQFIALDITDDFENERIRQQLTASALHIEKTKRFTNEIETTLNAIIAENNKINLSDFKSISDIIKTYSQSDKEWEQISTLIESVHPQFVSRLKSICPSLSAYDIKHCACIRLNFETKEIARFFNVKPESIQTARRRLKKKLNLSTAIDLRDYIFNI